jgi:asparagine synthase (glutamine-hydrolysing)
MSILGLAPEESPDNLKRGLSVLAYSAESPQTKWHNAGVSLGVCDLSAISNSNQCCMLLDGRIDNGAELCDQLGIAKPYPAELLLQAYLRWQSDFPKHVVGDYAFAVWDGRERRMLLGRDVAGYRPLHYCIRGDELFFASTARGVLALNGMRAVPDERKVAAWLALDGDSTDRTFFEGISRVPPGHTVLFEHGRTTVRPFWEPQKMPLLRLADPREYAEGLRSVLEQAVRDRIAPGLKIGSQLSGGLDSSSVTVIAAELLAARGERLTSFTAVPAVAVDEKLFPGRFIDERSHATLITDSFPNIDPVLISNHAEPMFPVLDRMSAATERPQLNPLNAIWVHAINMEAQRQGLDVVLEAVIGNFTISHSGARALPMLFWGGRLGAAARLAAGYMQSGQGLLSIGSRVLGPVLPTFARNQINSLRGIATNMAAQATGARPEFLYAHGHRPEDFPSGVRIIDGKACRILWLTMADLGMYVSASQRLFGVEQSNPTADRRVIDFCLSVPEEQYCLGGRERSLIRDAMAGKLPDKVRLERRKGLQAADFFPHLTLERDEINRELDRMQQSDLISRAVDLPALKNLTVRWPANISDTREWFDYCLKLTRAISIGRFVRRIEDGTIFSS